VLEKAEETGQRSHLTIMFTDLCDSTHIASQMEPENYSDILERMGKDFVTIVNKHGGEVIRIDGDGFIFVFGYPTFHEDHSRRAVEAALDIHNALEEIEKTYGGPDMRLRMHTGIHSGIVLVKQGDIARGKYEILGDPTNVTARLCDFAAPGEIIISHETLGRAGYHFQVAQDSLVSFKGRTEKLRVKKIIGRNAGGDRKTIWATHSANFTGRDTELAWLKDFVTSGNRHSAMAHIQAEAGMGKSRLLHEFSKAMTESGQSAHNSICESYLGTESYHPIRQLIRSILSSEFGYTEKNLQRLSEDATDTVKNIVAFLHDKAEQQSGSNHYTEKLQSAFSALCRDLNQSRIILIIDDWQWADDASKNIIQALVKSDPERLRIILASRIEDSIFVEMNGADNLRLPPLNSADIRAAIRKLIPGVEPFTLARIETHCGGNPLYLEELCHAIKDLRFSFDDKKTDSWLNALIYTRFEQLPTELAEIVRIASIIGYIVPEWLFNQISDVPISAEKLKVLRQTDFLYPADTQNHLRFKHGITRDVIYEKIGLKYRRQFHRKIINELNDQAEKKGQIPPHDQLAFHNGQAGNANAALHHSRIAGQSALKSFSLGSAQKHFKNALLQANKANIESREKLSLLRNYGLSCVVDPNKAQTPILEKAALAANRSMDQKSIAWSEYWLGFNLYGLGYPNKSIFHFERAYKACLDIEDIKLETQLLANLGQAYAAACEYDIAYKYLDEAISIKLKHRSADKVSSGLAYAISCKGFALGEQGHYRSAMTCFSQAIDVLSGSEHSAATSILNQRAVVNMWQGNHDECLRLTEQTHEMSRRMHSRYNFAQSVFITACINFQKTKKNSYIDKMIEATDWLVFDGTGQNMSLNYGCISNALTQVKDWKRARIYSARGLKRIRAGDRRCESQIYRSLALLAQAGESSNNADTYMRKAIISAQNRKSPREIKNSERFQALHFTGSP